MVVLPDLGTLAHAASYRFYRDELTWHNYPVYPPSAKVKNPGKQPAVKAWWNFNPHDCDIDRWFNPKRPYNIGVAPKNGLVLVDLDSKVDKGASVQAYLHKRPELSNTPTHISRGGVHKVYLCPDLPKFAYPNGKPYHERLIAQITPRVTAELYHSDHSNVVLPPSQHAIDGFIYAWIIFGEVQVVTWQWLQDTYGFRAPIFDEPKGKSRKTQKWWESYRGDLSSLDLIGLLASLGHDARADDADEGRYIVKCPWRDSEHSDPTDDTGAKVWQVPEAYPQFYCHHNSCRAADRGLKEVLKWAEGKSPGIVDKFCAHQRVWHAGQKSRQGLPRVLHAVGRLESTVYSEIGTILAPHHAWYVRGSCVNVIEQIPSGFVYSDDPTERYQVAATLVGFRELSALQAKGALEKYMEPGVLINDGDGQEFSPKSFSTDFCAGLLQSDQLKEKLPRIARILTAPLPFRVGGRLLYPKKGYDPRFATYLLSDAPELYRMSIEDAHAKIDSLLSGFCFTNDQSKTHAIARILTPFARGLLGWTIRVPLWFFSANRPRAGKDYLAACTLIIYEGASFEDLPIGKESEETAKRIMSAARNGRRFMHFSNCQVYLQDQYLIQALTNPVIAGRRLGSNEATSDLSVPNEMEFSLSGNIGLTFRDDLEPRMRKIELAFFEEDANSRTFPDKFLHRTIKDDRAGFLSAIAAIYRGWAAVGFPEGKTPFTTYPEWAAIVGGVMQANGYGDPCLPFKGKYDDSAGDNKSRSMTELFKVCFNEFPSQKVKKTELYRHVHGARDENDALSWFGALEDDSESVDSEQIHKNRTRLGKLLFEFEGRILNGIRLIIDKSSGHPSRYTYQFVKVGAENAAKTPDFPHENAENAAKTPDFPHEKTGAREGDNFATSSQSTSCEENYHLESCHPVTLEKEGDREGDNSTEPLPEPIASPTCHPVTQNATRYAYAREIQNEEGICDLDLHAVSVCDPLEGDKGDRVTGDFLGLDLETYAEIKVARRGTPKIATTREALNPWKGDIRLVTLSDGENIQVYDLHEGPLPDCIRAAIERSTVIVHNACFDLLFLKVRLGIMPAKIFCTMTASRLLTPSRTVRHALGATLERYLDIKLAKEHGASDWGAMLLTQEQLLYASDDVRHLHALRTKLEERLKAANLWEVFELEMCLIPLVIAMEEHGFAVDRPKLEEMRSTAAVTADGLTVRLREGFAEPELSVDSPQQLLAAFKAAGIELDNTDEATLSACSDPRTKEILAYRQADKLATSIKGLLKAIGKDGRIHARFSPTGAVSGRFSSSGPNLQSVTRGPLRSCFVPSAPDRSLIVADYSQIELRIGAHFARDKAMLAAFRAKKDLHRETAAFVLSKSVEQVSKDDRQLAKAVNFGFLYGQRPDGFRIYARTQYGIILTLEQAAKLRTKFFERYCGLAEWHREAWIKAEAAENQARTIFGRLLCAQGDRDWDMFQLHTSALVSGSAADVIKKAMVKTVSVLPSDVPLVATVHDELIFDCPRAQAPMYAGIIRAAMEEAFHELFPPELPIEVEAKVVENWGEK
jgi:DNA polymerase I-like protein with 3'-5' exonuclease and polymerase domains